MYTNEETDEAIKLYLDANKDNSIIATIAAKLGKTPRSIVGKLSREGVYEKEVYKTKLGGTPVSKKELVHRISTKLEIDVNIIEGLEKAPKKDLQNLWETLEKCNGNT